MFLFLIFFTFTQAATLNISAPEKIEKGKALPISYQVTGATQNMSLGFWVMKDIPLANKHNVPGPEGVLMLRSIPVAAGGAGIFTWDGASFGCSPLDAPIICSKPLEPGKVIVEAVLYEGLDVPLELGMVDPSRYKPPMILARAKSAVLTVFGAPNLEVLESRLSLKARSIISEEFQLYIYTGTGIENYVKPVGELLGPDAIGNYCRKFSYKQPFAGEVTVCGPNSFDTSRFTFKGKVSFAPGVFPYAEASSLAHALAEKPYLPRVRFRRQPGLQDRADPNDPNGTTYLSDGLTNWAYHADGGYWIFVIFEIMAGGSGARKGEFAENVIVRVDNAGKACVVKTVPYKNGLGLDIFKDKITCP